jgi:uncharacterized protein GlcG (DUF336 family)
MDPLTVAVLDSGGHLLSFQREDGSGILRSDIAIGKAWGALGMGIPSRTIRDRLKDRPAFQNALAVASQGRFIPVPGGVLACNQEGDVLGAVGISGDTSEKDEYCAIEGIKAAGLIPNPEEPSPDWQHSGHPEVT